jgi:hypothetical protein
MPRSFFETLARSGLLFGAIITLALCMLPAKTAGAHHILGRPAYNLGEDSNTPSSLQTETRIGGFDVTTMVFPAFPQPESPGRISLYVTRVADGSLFDGVVAFTVRDDSWRAWFGFGAEELKIGAQRLDDGVFRQSFHFHEAGDYIVSAAFQADGEPHIIDFPLRVGPPSSVGPIGVALAFLAALLLTVSIIQRRRAMTGKIRGAREGQSRGPR